MNTKNKIPFSGAIFDIDGTLIDSMGVWKSSTVIFYEKRGLVLTDEEFESFKSCPLSRSLPYIKEKYNLKETVEEIAAEYDKTILNAYENTIPPKPGAVSYLRYLKENGVKIAAATSAKTTFCEAVFKRLEVFDLFDAFAFSDEVGVDKTNPDVYLLAAERLGEKPKNCMIFEDILCGIQSGKNAGFKTCAVYDNTNKSDTELLKSTADIYITNWKELL